MERFYLIVGHVSQLELLVPHGVRLVQLRLKDRPEQEIRRQIARARDFCAVHGAQLVVNDHWQAALDLYIWGKKTWTVPTLPLCVARA